MIRSFAWSTAGVRFAVAQFIVTTSQEMLVLRRTGGKITGRVDQYSLVVFRRMTDSETGTAFVAGLLHGATTNLTYRRISN